jgi:hypothetical protein
LRRQAAAVLENGDVLFLVNRNGNGVAQPR